MSRLLLALKICGMATKPYPLMTCELALIDAKMSYLCLTHTHTLKHTQSVREVTPLLIGFRG